MRTPHEPVGIEIVTLARQQSYGLPLAAAAWLKAQTSSVADVPGGPVMGIAAGLREIGPLGTLTPEVSDVALMAFAQAGLVTVSL